MTQMKNITKKILVAGSLTVILFGGCKKTWLDINNNPNLPVDASIDPSTLLGGALLTTATNVTTGYQFLSHWFGFLNTSSGVSPNADEQSYNISNSFSNAFGTILDNNFDYNQMQVKADASGMTFYSGIAKVMKSLNYARMVDLYGDIPYSQTFNAPANLTPKYDDAKTVYEDLIKQIDAGIVQIKAAVVANNPRIATVDKMFAGNQIRWIRFANTIKLRILMHQANRSDRQDYIKTQIAAIVAEGSGFIGSGASATINPGYSQSQPNPFYATYEFNTTGGEPSQERANAILVNQLKLNNDPRLSAVYQSIATAVPATAAEPTTNLNPYPQVVTVVNTPATLTTPASVATTVAGPNQLSYRGGVYGLSIDNSTFKYQTRNYLSKVGGITTAGASSSSVIGLIKGWDAPIWIMTSVESLFLQAEAIQRGYLAGDAQSSYAAAVKESYLFLNASTIETITTVTDAVPPATAKTTTVNTNTITP
ncbi:MAG: SusD/RagB family nutrient-binding outer membrane lipoprotein, partial [Sphingobacteriaceae bacterium]